MKKILTAFGLYILGLPWIPLCALISGYAYKDFTRYLARYIFIKGTSLRIESAYYSLMEWVPWLLLTGTLCWFIGWIKQNYMTYALSFAAGMLVMPISLFLLPIWFRAGKFTILHNLVLPALMIVFCVFSAWLGHRYRFRNIRKQRERAFPVQSM